VTTVKPAGSFGHAVPGAGFGFTVRAALPVTPPLVAVIVADPAATPLTSPLPLTVATAVLLDAQLTVPLSTVPTASLRVAPSCTVCPTVTLTEDGLTATEATEPLEASVPLATFESPPNTAFTPRVPRYATSWNWYPVAAASPSTVHVRLAPMAVPATGVAHVPLVTLAADPQEIVPAARRIS
jgi:hypothetical protein